MNLGDKTIKQGTNFLCKLKQLSQELGSCPLSRLEVVSRSPLCSFLRGSPGCRGSGASFGATRRCAQGQAPGRCRTASAFWNRG